MLEALTNMVTTKPSIFAKVEGRQSHKLVNETTESEPEERGKACGPVCQPVLGEGTVEGVGDKEGVHGGRQVDNQPEESKNQVGAKEIVEGGVDNFFLDLGFEGRFGFLVVGVAVG